MENLYFVTLIVAGPPMWLARLTVIQDVPGSIPGYTLEIFP